MPRTATGVLLLALTAPLHAAPGGLDTSLQLLKQRSLELERDVLILQEQVDAPLVIYFSMRADRRFKPESLHILLDGKPLTTLDYTPDTLDALRRGGAQRVYRDGVSPGEHELIAYYRSNRDYQQGAKIRFRKTRHTQVLEIVVQQQPGTESRLQPEVLIRQWDVSP